MGYQNNNKSITSFLLFILFACLSQAVNAEIIELKLDNGHVVTAEYSQGETDAPSVLITHGFLQTREFHTVMRIYESLAESGYNVLAPTLSLGLNRRKKSLACEAIHFHSMHSDIEEINLWVQWLKNKNNKNIILLGHSAGSLQNLAYLSKYKNPPVDRSIYISLVHFGQGIAAKESVVDYERAKLAIKKGKNEVDKYGLSYCAEYPTLPENFMSYYEWDKKKILSELDEIKISSHVIFGSEDKRIDTNWINLVKSTGIEALIIQGANHFFVSEHEFDLQDAIENLLSGA